MKYIIGNNQKRRRRKLFGESFLIICSLMILISITGSVSALKICQYANQTSASSENNVSSAIYAIGAPDAPLQGHCMNWSGSNYSWSPVNWSTKALLTLQYETPVIAKNLTIFGDYDSCWNRIILKDSSTGRISEIFNGMDNTCTKTQFITNNPADFFADTAIIETCGWSWSAVDAVELCGELPTEPVCGNNILENPEGCDDGNLIDSDGCSSGCMLEEVDVFFAPYMGDLDGSIDPAWFGFYEQVIEWHKNNSIPIGLSIYSSTMTNDYFNSIIRQVYLENITEPILKCEESFNGTLLDMMTYEQANESLNTCLQRYLTGLEKTGISNVKKPAAYNQKQGRFTETIRDVIHDLGFKIYFEQYVSEYDYIDVLPDFDITQYSVSFTRSGTPGADEIFKQPDEIIDEIINFNNSNMIHLNGIKIVPMLSHQQDFLISENSTKLNETKWEIYTTTLKMAQSDPRIGLLHPEDIYELRHQPICGNNILENNEECDDGNTASGDGCSSKCRIEIEFHNCQYAKTSVSDSESNGYEAIYATGPPDSDKSCNTAPLLHTSWQKKAWNVPSNITVYFESKVFPETFTIFGDHDLCINRIWIRKDGTWYTAREGAINNGLGENCTISYDFSFIDGNTDEIKIETCGWTRSAIDSVRLCGSNDTYADIEILNPEQGRIVQEHTNELFIRTDAASKCEFSFSSNFTFEQSIPMQSSDGFLHSYMLTSPAGQDHIEVYYICNTTKGNFNPYSKRHHFMIRDPSIPFAEICSWQGCTQGAATISIDDGYHYATKSIYATCHDELEEQGLRGTYFLSFTDIYNDTGWEYWRDIRLKGHEIGSHSTAHTCSYDYRKEEFQNDINSNLLDISTNLGIPVEKIISYAWPCGVATNDYITWLPENFISARGYHVNMIEDATPENLRYLKNIDSTGYSLTHPQDYHQAADAAQNYNGLVNYVFHDKCDHPEIIPYLKQKGHWVSTVGNITKYIISRNNIDFSDIKETTTGFSFIINNPLNRTIFDNEITIRVYLPLGTIDRIIVNGTPHDYSNHTISHQNYAQFRLQPENGILVEITGLYTDTCRDIDLDGYYAMTSGCSQGNDCNDYDNTIFPGAPEIICNGIDNDCDNIIDNNCSDTLFCQFAESASATSESSGSLATFATGSPDAATKGCTLWEEWSGYGYSWSPQDWQVKANITLNYANPVNISNGNITIFGDYDICYENIWVKNTETGDLIEITGSTHIEENCTTGIDLEHNILTDSIIINTCGWSWSSTDAVELCGIKRGII